MASASLLSVRLVAACRVLGLVKPQTGFAATWRGLLVRDDQLPAGSLINVVVLGVPLCNHSEPKKKGETRCKIQSRTSPPNADSTGLCPVSCSPGVLLRFTFFEGTEKIHMFVLPP